jgi:hypothetical protein
VRAAERVGQEPAPRLTRRLAGIADQRRAGVQRAAFTGGIVSGWTEARGKRAVGNDGTVGDLDDAVRRLGDAAIVSDEDDGMPLGCQPEKEKRQCIPVANTLRS